MSSWHSESDIPIRLMILRKTHETFQRIRLPCDPEVFQNTLEEIVPQLELALYNNATSLEEYGNPRTVEQRLEAIAPLHVQLNPLEVLWLQGLFSTGTPVASYSSSGDVERRLSFSIGSAPSQPRQQHLPSLLVTTEPSQVRTPQDADIVLEPAGPSLRGQQETDPSTGPNRDPYTQSLVELYQVFQEYDEASSGLGHVEISRQEGDLILLDAAQNPSIEVPDLTCHEDLNGNGNA